MNYQLYKTYGVNCIVVVVNNEDGGGKQGYQCAFTLIIVLLLK